MKVFTTLIVLCTSVFTCIAQVAEKDTDISPLLIGEKVPSLSVVSTEGNKVPLEEVLKQQPSVLLFYRGGWCPFCNRHLSAVGEIQNEIDALGYQIIGFSPDSPKNLKTSKEKGALAYKLFSDADGELIKAMGIAFKAPERYSDRLDKFSGGLNSGFLPVPSAFIVDTDGTILFEYISPNYKQRMSANMLLEILKQLKEK
ncbi:peroxiredoxin-like family protein [Flavivirga aquimarina]|uniref:thioredoxin-dependent peroxiredoxin n=1 Tax=Flavivirga aquimarina TaxID=2027862 RepID=A0ABT8W885_9FLAO|nr:peroxiredoxin-like family protein [Flavivirga aquimarina]MDO5969343.1 peroxiredoxin-like family protein [Flavivirga aquimarina]